MVNLGRLAGVETDEERQLAVAMRVGVMFLVVLYFSVDELRYSIWGATGQATVAADGGLTGITTDDSPMAYQLMDKDQNRYKGIVPKRHYDLIDNGKLMIDYIPGKTHKSRIAGDRNWFALGMLLLAFIVAAAMIYPLFKEASDYAHGRSGKKR